MSVFSYCWFFFFAFQMLPPTDVLLKLSVLLPCGVSISVKSTSIPGTRSPKKKKKKKTNCYVNKSFSRGQSNNQEKKPLLFSELLSLLIPPPPPPSLFFLFCIRGNIREFVVCVCWLLVGNGCCCCLSLSFFFLKKKGFFNWLFSPGGFLLFLSNKTSCQLNICMTFSLQKGRDCVQIILSTMCATA